MFKKLINHIPFVNIALIVMMWAGCHFASNAADTVDSYDTWVSQPETLFGLNDIAAMFGHMGAAHLAMNVAWLLFFGVAAEILLGKVRYLAWVTTIMGTWLVISELLPRDNSGIGASGWLYAMPGVLMYASARFVDKVHNEELGYMAIPAFIYAMSFIAVVVDISQINQETGVGHDQHILGAIVGMIPVLAAMPMFISMGKCQLNNSLTYRKWKMANAR